jgi:hypothetical protein
MVQVGSQIIYIYIYMDVLNFFLSYFVNSQIWLNQLMDDHHLGYITKWGGRGCKSFDITHVHAIFGLTSHTCFFDETFA